MATNKARDITESTVKELFGLSGNKCANPDCSNSLIHTDGTIVGEICHIEAASEKGERYNYDMTDDQRRRFNNLILLCANCHKITNNIEIYTVETLQRMKENHENTYRNNRYLPGPKTEEKILAKFAYDISYTEVEEWGILEDIIKFVNENAPKNNPSPEQLSEGSNFTHIKEKVRLNFPKVQWSRFQDTYVLTNGKQQTAAKFLENIAAEDSVQVDELREYIVSKYRDIKGSSAEDIPVDDMKTIDDLAYLLIPVTKRNSPSYHASAKAIVLQSFEYCHIGRKTENEQLINPSLFD